jgi:hypothetical protein
MAGRRPEKESARRLGKPEGATYWVWDTQGKLAPEVRKRRRGKNLTRAVAARVAGCRGTPGETLKGSETLREDELRDS